MKRYLHECKGCAVNCKLATVDLLSVPRHCPSKEGMAKWERAGEFEQYEEAPGEIAALKSKLETVGREMERYAHACQRFKEENDQLRRRFDGLKEWIAALLALGTSGLENITGGKAGQE